MNNGLYENYDISNDDFFNNDSSASSLMNDIYWYYDEFLYNRDGYHVDNDTECTIYADFEVDDNNIYYLRARAEFEFVDETNTIVNQTVYINFNNGDICIKDDDFGIIFNGNETSFAINV